MNVTEIALNSLMLELQDRGHVPRDSNGRCFRIVEIAAPHIITTVGVRGGIVTIYAESGAGVVITQRVPLADPDYAKKAADMIDKVMNRLGTIGPTGPCQ